MDKKASDRTVAHARMLIGAPFLHQGRTPAGIDCIGVVVWALQQCAILPTPFERTDYDRNPSEDDLLTRSVEQYCDRIPAPAHGCMLTLAWHKHPPHVALYADDAHARKRFGGPTLIHADARIGIARVTEIRYAGAWARLKAVAWQLPLEPVRARE